jgi:hypothetical protein
MVAAGFAVPLMVTACGEFAALSVMTRLVVRTPAARGEKTRVTLQAAFAANVPVHVLELIEKSAALPPFKVGADAKVSEALPEFVMLMDCAALEMPCVVMPGKFKVPGIRVICGAGGGGAMAVPDNATDCGLPAALSVITKADCVVPTTVGA